ncbi:MAG: ABC transporter ATP-binding protein [Candidatus Omnitrophica bacterium]|nr:ABC transporter ATP-binding protein [Candidatus Omnitrophota bacterium]MDD5311013.1 ABC transporter ATP-binding protein [Candidatus Omnitrophota bacterium]MDD5546563.1 ABC transporter ATP-binding protein [Candidatus Omnitrophota bacterium]
MIEARALRKVYKNGAKELEVLKGVDLKVKRSEVLAVLGPSGAGKSTLLHLLGGLDSPTAGEVLIGGTDIYSLGDNERAKIRNRKIGFVFQFYHLLPEFDALENVILPLMIKGGGRDLRERGAGLLKAVGLEDRMNHRPGQLSGGEQQRVAIARALINEPELLLCDEPTGNLDSESGENIIELLWELNKSRKMTLMIVTHDAQIAKAAQRVLHIRDGKIIQ